MELTKEHREQIAQKEAIDDLLKYIMTNGSQEDTNTVCSWLVNMARWIQFSKGGVYDN